MKWLLPLLGRSTCGTLLGLTLMMVGTRTASAASPFPDKNLEAAIRNVLKHEPKLELTDDKLQNVYILEAPVKTSKT